MISVVVLLVQKLRKEHSTDRCRCRPELRRDLGAIGPYEFQGDLYRLIPWCLVFRENLYGLMALKVLSKVSSEIGIGLWMALPRNSRKVTELFCQCLTIFVVAGNGSRVKSQRAKTSENLSEESNLPRRFRRYPEIL